MITHSIIVNMVILSFLCKFDMAIPSSTSLSFCWFYITFLFIRDIDSEMLYMYCKFCSPTSSGGTANVPIKESKSSSARNYAYIVSFSNFSYLSDRNCMQSWNILSRLMSSYCKAIKDFYDRWSFNQDQFETHSKLPNNRQA